MTDGITAGCSVEDLLSSFHKPSDDTQNGGARDGRGSPIPGTSTSQAGAPIKGLVSEEHVNIWRWIASKSDVSVGEDRKWNHLDLHQVLELPEEPPNDSSGTPDGGVKITHPPASNRLPKYRPRLYLTETRMWECLAGHAIDYQKLPRFEWLALVGIASVMESGILQGDLTRLIGQDKRSLPKRTDELARKGYIEKRPILARGCKTSKLWLKPFAPATPDQNKPAEIGADTAKDSFPRAALVTDLEPVPWRDHWTGTTIDYAMLGRTIMAVIKEFGVIRYADLRVKLGVAGVHWQMKVVTRTCRFFIELGLIQYVTASLGNRLYRDCLKFKRNLTTEDLSAFISGGGSAFRFGNNHEPRKASSKRPEGRVINEPPAEGWIPDKPLTISILETILASGEDGITNKGLAYSTIGGCHERHVSAVSTAVSVKNSQPVHLKHLQARKEYCRSGRIAAYRFFRDTQIYNDSEVQSQSLGNAHGLPGSSNATARVVLPASDNSYGFGALELMPRSRPPKKLRADTNASKYALEEEHGESRKRRKVDIMNGASDAARTEAVQTQSEVKSHEPTCGREEVIVASTPTDLPQGPNNRKRGRGRKPDTGGDNLTPSLRVKGTRWVCETCGGSWKNDIGLKYHLTKSQTPCNPTYVENPLPRAARKPRGGKARQAPRAVYRLGECKVLARRRWKGDVTLKIRQSLQRSAMDDTRPGLRKANRACTQNHSNESGLGVSKASIGGVIKSPLWKLQDAATIYNPLRVNTSDLGKTLHQGGPEMSPPGQAAPSRRQNTPRGTASLSSRSSSLNFTTGRGEWNRESGEGEVDGSSSSVEHANEAEMDGLEAKVENSEPTHNVAMFEEVPPFKPSPELKDSIAIGEALDTLRCKEIVVYLLRSNGGAFPARVSLWHAVVVVWHRSFSKDPIPSYPINQRAVRELIKKKKVVENMFAFRNAAGAISDCFLLVKHGTDPNLPRFQELKASMKSAHPKPYIPRAFSHSTSGVTPIDSDNVPQWARGRGKPVTSIEVLDAPIYIHQATQGRRPVPDNGHIDDDDDDLHCKSVASLPRGPYKPSRTFKATPASHWSPATTHWQPVNTPSGGVMFLKPNTRLLEEAIPIDPALEASFSNTARDLADPFVTTPSGEGDADPESRGPRNIQFMENAEIRQHGDEWPDLENEFFEAGEGSFTVIGSAPDKDTPTQYHHRHRTWISSEAGPNGPMYAPYMTQEQHEDHLVATPVRAVNARGSAPRGRPRIRREQYPARPKLPERALTRIKEVEGDPPSNLNVPPIFIGDFTVDEALTVAFVAIRMLLGGSNKVIDWGLIMKLFPDHTLDDLRRFWLRLSKERVHFLTSFTEKFQDEFLSAYENDELPPLDYDNILGYDWQQLIDWGIALRRTNFVRLPVRRSKGADKATKRDFVLQDHTEQPRHWHERFFHYQASVFTRFELSTSAAAAIMMPPKNPSPRLLSEVKPSLVEEAISWVRSLCCTATDKCAPEVVRNKLMTLSEDSTRVNKVLDEAVNNLNNRRIITKRIRTRPYMLSRPFQTNLAKFGQQKKFRSASEFKASLDKTFRRGEALKISFLTNDGMQMALMNLYAAGRISIDSTGVPKVPLGFRPGNYESRKMPKSHLLFDLHATPTGDYLYDENIGILQRAGDKAPPAKAPGRLLPFWVDFFGDTNPEMWTKLLGLVCFMLAIRGSMPFSMLALQTKNYLEDYDLQLLVGWCKEVGLVVEDADSGGLSVTEWWWLVVGRQKEWSDDEEMEPFREVARGRGRPRRSRDGRGKEVVGVLCAAIEARD